MNEKMERLLTILQDVNDEIDFAHERHMVDDGLIDSLECGGGCGCPPHFAYLCACCAACSPAVRWGHRWTPC